MTALSTPLLAWARFAWLNTRRNRRRSLVTVAIAALGTAAILLAGGFALSTYQGLAEASARTTGDCMMPWLLITAPSHRDQAALTSAVVTAPQSNGVSSLPSSTRS